MHQMPYNSYPLPLPRPTDCDEGGGDQEQVDIDTAYQLSRCLEVANLLIVGLVAV